VTLCWINRPERDTVNAENSISAHFPPTSETPMTEEHRTMLALWWGMSGKATPEFLANNLIRKFNLEKGKAWILAVRYINEKRG
jgi:hypothetical protein